MNTALLVVRLVAGLLLMGHGLQKLVPPEHSPRFLNSSGHRATGESFQQLGIRPGIAAAGLAGTAELIGGFSFAAGLLTPIGTILVGAVMTTAILTVHVRNGLWNAEGGFEFPLLLLAISFAIPALGPGAYSIDHWAGIDDWAGIDWTVSPATRATIALAIGVAVGLVTAVAARRPQGTSSRLSAQTGE